MRWMRKITAIAALLILQVGCTSTGDQPGNGKRLDGSRALSPEVYRLTPGDRVRVDIYQEPDLSGEFDIEPDGTVNYPLLGRVSAAGESISQLQRRIRKGLSEGYIVDPDVRVAIAKYKPIYVVGAIVRPGQYGFKPGMTAQQAITLAGGPTKFASEKIYVQRHNTRPSESYRISADTALYPGDIISIEERLF